MTSRRCLAVALACAAVGLGRPSQAQVRGQPVFFPSTYAYSARAGLDLGHGGEAGGVTIAAGGSLRFYQGNCARIRAEAAAGIWNPPGDDFDAELNAGAGVSYLVNPCPRPTSAPNPTIRVMVGAGWTRVGGRTVWNVPLGVGAGYLVEVPIVRLEPWVTPRVHYRESLAAAGESEWQVAFSAGVTLGAGPVGLRAALDCCEGGLGGGYGLSLWF